MYETRLKRQEQDAPPLSVEFPKGEKVIFLGNMAYGSYGSAAQVVDTTEKTLDIGLAVSLSPLEVQYIEIQFFPSEANEIAEFKKVVTHRVGAIYYASYDISRRLKLPALALSRITSSLLVQLSDGSKTNIGLSLKFESKSMKVLGFTRRNDRGWEFSEKAAQVLERYKVRILSIAYHALIQG